MWWISLTIIALLFSYIYTLLSRGITKSSTCLVGKTAIITGANAGIGYQTALNLASRGCKVIMADVANMEESKRNIIKYSNNSNIVTKYLDLSSLKAVREFAADINATTDRLDVLINHAGIPFSENNRTPDDLHPVMQINYFGHFLLTHLLMDLLKKSAPSRIVSTSSCMAFFHNLSLENLNFDGTQKTNWQKFIAYNNSKLAILIMADRLAEKLKGSGVTSNSVHPGVVGTNSVTDLCSFVDKTPFTLFIRFYFKIYSKDPWQGSQALVHAAISKKLENISGQYFWDCKPFFKPSAASNKEFCKSVWEASERWVELREHEKL